MSQESIDPNLKEGIERDLTSAKSLLENRNAEAERIHEQIERTKEFAKKMEGNEINHDESAELSKLDQEYSEVIAHAQEIKNYISDLEGKLH